MSPTDTHGPVPDLTTEGGPRAGGHSWCLHSRAVIDPTPRSTDPRPLSSVPAGLRGFAASADVVGTRAREAAFQAFVREGLLRAGRASPTARCQEGSPAPPGCSPAGALARGPPTPPPAFLRFSLAASAGPGWLHEVGSGSLPAPH